MRAMSHHSGMRSRSHTLKMRISAKFQDRFKGWMAVEAMTFIRISYPDDPLQ